MISLQDLIQLAYDLDLAAIVRYNHVVICGVDQFLFFTREENDQCLLVKNQPSC